MHLSLILYVTKLTHFPAIHFLSITCFLYSSSKYFKVDNVGFGAVWPRPHKDVFFIVAPKVFNNSKSLSLPLPSVILVNKSNNCFVPNLHGAHLPHYSSTAN